MAEEITVGTVLGGRYLVTGEVVATAEGDLVFDGTDQVLNRPVSILMAAPSNATRVAVSAREIAMGTRPSTVQVLDLGLNAASTYLITNTTDAASLLDLVVEADAPYIEPFQTDTLGQQIFGETRSTEPQVYEDDAEYYQELAEEQQRKPLFGGRWGRKNRSEAAPETASQGVIPPSVPMTGAGVSEPVTGPFAAEPMAASEAAAAFPAEPAEPAQTPSDSPASDDDLTQSVPRTEAPQPAVTPLPPVVVEPTSPGLRSDAEAARAAAERGDAHRPASRFPRAAATPAAAATAPDDDAQDPREGGPAAAAAVTAGSAGAGASGTAAQRSAFDAAVAQSPRPTAPVVQRSSEDSGNKVTRLIVGLLLVAVLVTGVIFAVQILNRSSDPGPTPVATDPGTTTNPETSATPPSSQGPAKVKPKVDKMSLAFPSNPESVYSTANQSLKDAVDGSSSSSFSTYTYKSPVFGGFTKRATFAIELKKESDISAVELSGMNAKGGKVAISVGESDDPDEARDIFSGSFSGPELSADVGSGETMKGKYVFVTITELPELASPVSPERPYGFQVSEIKVS